MKTIDIEVNLCSIRFKKGKKDAGYYQVQIKGIDFSFNSIRQLVTAAMKPLSVSYRVSEKHGICYNSKLKLHIDAFREAQGVINNLNSQLNEDNIVLQLSSSNMEVYNPLSKEGDNPASAMWDIFSGADILGIESIFETYSNAVDLFVSKDNIEGLYDLLKVVMEKSTQFLNTKHLLHKYLYQMLQNETTRLICEVAV